MYRSRIRLKQYCTRAETTETNRSATFASCPSQRRLLFRGILLACAFSHVNLREVRETHSPRHTTGRDGEIHARVDASRVRRRAGVLALGRRAEDTRLARRRGCVEEGCPFAGVLGGHAQALAIARRARVGAGPRRGVL